VRFSIEGTNRKIKIENKEETEIVHKVNFNGNLQNDIAKFFSIKNM
jgi:hypothetical protein